jgi:hypothetical protein
MSNSTDKFNDFDPNGAKITLWGVWNGATFTVKSQRGGMLTRLRNLMRGKLYELTPSGWVLRAVKDLHAHSDNCDLCKRPDLRATWAAKDAQSPYKWEAGVKQGWVWKRQGGKITAPPELLLVCPDCKEATGWY